MKSWVWKYVKTYKTLLSNEANLGFILQLGKHQCGVFFWCFNCQIATIYKSLHEAVRKPHKPLLQDTSEGNLSYCHWVYTCRLHEQQGNSLCGKGFVPCKNEYLNLCSSHWTRRKKNDILNWEDCIEVLGLWCRRILKALGNLFTKETGYSGFFYKYWKIKWQCKVESMKNKTERNTKRFRAAFKSSTL